MKVVLGEAVGGNIYSDRLHEELETEFIQSCIKPDWTCLDIGANIGYFSILLGMVCTSGKVIAVEPLEGNAQLTKFNIDLNSLPNCEVEFSALGKSIGKHSFNVSTDSAFSGFKDTGRKSLEKEIDVNVITPLALVEKYNLKKIDFIKIDVEGAEYLIFEAFEHVFDITKTKIIMSECNADNLSAYGYSTTQYIHLMHTYNYDPYVLLTNGKLMKATPEILKFHDNVIFKLKA